MKEFFIDKFEYNFASNKTIIDLIVAAPNAAYTETTQTLICHTLNAQNFWNHRILGITPTQEIWQNFETHQLHEINQNNHDQSMDILEKMDLKTIIDYTTTKGVAFSNSVEDIFYHVVNHGTYHRGQLITELKQQGVTPISTDYIFFKR